MHHTMLRLGRLLSGDRLQRLRRGQRILLLVGPATQLRL
eukprot:COSAG01_NODE_50194_length_365_cov_0.969925_2_plen_38_part_01